MLIFVNCFHMRTLRFYGLLLALLAASCSKDRTDVPGATPAIYSDVAYGNDPGQRMDIYLPGGRSAALTKVIVLIHGGAWVSGDKSDFTTFMDSIRHRLPGYAIFNINYRLANNGANVFPAQENDTKDAISFIYQKRNDYLISDKFVLLGVSAGAHLALLQGYKYETPVKVKAVVDFFGPTDMADLYYNPASPLIPSTLIETIVGATPATNPGLYEQSSPLHFVNTSSAPTIILQGGADLLVSPSQSTALRDRLAMKGVPHQYVYYPQEGHGWLGANLTDSFNRIVAFLAAQGL